MKKTISFVLILVFFVSFASAINIEKQPITNVIVPQYDQPAEIQLVFSDFSPGNYNIYTLTHVTLRPIERFYLDENQNELTAKVYPTDNLQSRGFYTFTYFLRDSDGINHENRMTVKVVDLRDLIEISSEPNYPGDEMTFYIENKENAKLENLEATFSSIFFEKTENFNLNPFEKKEFTVSIDSDKLKGIPAGSYLLEASFNVDRGENIVKGNIYFQEQRQVEIQQDKQGFIVRTESIEKYNSGNTLENIQVTIERNLLTSSFTFFSISPDRVERQGLKNTYIWDRQLNPDSSFDLKARTNFFIPLLILIIIGITAYIFSVNNKTRIQVKKSVSHVKTKGGEFALRVRVKLKAKQNVQNVSVIEKIPAIVKVHEQFGAIKPSSINLKERRLQWNLGDLQVGEERLLSYVVYSKVGVVGKFALPEATVIFEENGKIAETFSNKTFFLSEQSDK